MNRQRNSPLAVPGNMSIFIGIDNGIGGALAAYDSETNQVECMVMPIVKVKVAKGNKNEYDVPEIVDWIDTFTPRGIRRVILERAQAFPGQGSVSMFSVGRGFGIMEGVLTAMGISYIVVHPRIWQKQMFSGVAHTDTKQASVLVAKRLFPNKQFTTGERSKKYHDGMTDATLLAYYGYKNYK